MTSLSKTALAGIAALYLVAAPAQAQSEGEAPTRDTVVATVDGVEITLGHVIAARALLPEQFRQLPPQQLFQPLVEQLIEQTAIAMEAEDDLTARERIELENDRRSFISNAALTRAAEAAVTEEAVSEAYSAFVTEFDGREPTPEFNASHILVEDEALALELLAQLEAGADFAELAREHSIDGAAQGGGSLGWFGPGAMIPEFEAAVESLEVGNFMGPVETQFGYHLVLLNDTRMSTAPELDEVRPAIVAQIQREAVQAIVESTVADLEVTRSYEDLDPALLARSELLDE